jgi:two-component system, chemotaxis family, response regulator WspF
VTILSAFPQDFRATIIIVQHLNPEFLPGLVAWLDRPTPLPIALVPEGDYLEAEKVLLANTGNHLRLTENSQVTYSRNSSERLYCPSIEVFFAPLAESENLRGIAVLLTGMGNDGDEGLARYRAGG